MKQDTSTPLSSRYNGHTPPSISKACGMSEYYIEEAATPLSRPKREGAPYIYPPGNPTYPTWEKENHLQKGLFCRAYVSSQEGTNQIIRDVFLESLMNLIDSFDCSSLNVRIFLVIAWQENGRPSCFEVPTIMWARAQWQKPVLSSRTSHLRQEKCG